MPARQLSKLCQIIRQRIIMKKLIFLLFVSTFFFNTIYPQNCGGSTRTIQFDFPSDAKKPEKIYYRLFYLMPKRADRYFNVKQSPKEFQKVVTFLSNFIYDNPNPPNNYFWIADKETKFIEIPAEKAQKYAYGKPGIITDYAFSQSYKYIDFEGLLFRKHHLPQLQGGTCNGILYFETTEGDNTAFIMEVLAPDYEPLYFVSNFLGGCLLQDMDGKYPIQHIQMRPAKKKLKIRRFSFFSRSGNKAKGK